MEENGGTMRTGGDIEAVSSQKDRESAEEGMEVKDPPNEKTEAQPTVDEPSTVEYAFPITIKLPHEPFETSIMVYSQEQVQDLRQSVMESPLTFQYSCFHLEYNGQRMNDFMELSELKDLSSGSIMILVEDPYTEREARTHLMRIREIIGATGDRVDSLHGISCGSSLHSFVCPEPALPISKANGAESNQGSKTADPTTANYNFDAAPKLDSLLAPARPIAPKTIKSIAISAWDPPPPYLRQHGHLMYLSLSTNEGEQLQITSHITGFYVNKSSNNKFDPMPRQAPKHAYAHSLLSLISELSPSFYKTYNEILDTNSKLDPLVLFQLTNAIPATPWLVSNSAIMPSKHQPDIARTQESYLMSGLEGNETMRDWNEELQSTRELPRTTVQERVFRERLTSKIFAEFTDAATRGAVLVARGEITPLNPTEAHDAQIFVYNNIFFSFGADGVGTFASEGGDEAARVAVGKDVMGVKAINRLDIPGLATAGTIIVDYLGKRVVAQSIVPGIFKQRETDEHQVDYGGVEGRDVIADNDVFVPTFSQVSKALKIKAHPVWDKEKQRHDLEGSVETKGLLGTDGRKYILDLYRLTPLDGDWLDEHATSTYESKVDGTNGIYPHRMTVLRPELIESYWRLRLGEYVKEQMEVSRKAKDTAIDAVTADSEGVKSPTQGGTVIEEEAISAEKSNETALAPKSEPAAGEQNGKQREEDEPRIDISAFNWTLNTDVFCGQDPQTETEIAAWKEDEHQVRLVCKYLTATVIPDLLTDLKEADTGFPMDGQSLCRLLHKRGINIRYLGKLASMTDANPHGQALRALATQEMIARAFKHAVSQYLKDLPSVFATSCIAHLLNCLLGTGLNGTPIAQLDPLHKQFYANSNFAYTEVTPETLARLIESQVFIRYRYTLVNAWRDQLRHVQLLRSISLKLGLQLVAKDYIFCSTSLSNPDRTNVRVSEHTNASAQYTNGHSKKKKKANQAGQSIAHEVAQNVSMTDHTFKPDDIANVVPVVKDSCPKSALAEEALEAGKISLMQNQREIGQELLLESLTLHEQIYGALHPEVARVYHQLAMLYFQLDEKAAAVELAHKAVVISERTIGLDASETILSYLNLALFEHGNKNSSVAIACVSHALELWKIIYGFDHPDCMTTLNNAAVMLQQLQLYHDSRVWFEKSLSLSESVSGKGSVNTATLLFQLAQALVLDGDHKGAVHRMRDAYSIFLSKLGPDDPNTKESEKWLEQLTQNAVAMAKHAKDLQEKRVRRVIFNPDTQASPLTLRGQIPQAQAQNLVTPGNVTTTTSNGATGLDSRSIEELMKFIEGGANNQKSSKSHKKLISRGHMRRRSEVQTSSGAAIDSAA